MTNQLSPHSLLLNLFQDFIPACRSDAEASVSNLPNGKEFYETALKYFTADDVTAQSAHDLGLSEVKRITDQMKQVSFWAVWLSSFIILMYAADLNISVAELDSRKIIVMYMNRVS